MVDWPALRLADCVDLLAGFPFNSEKFSDRPEGGVPLVKGENVSQGRILWEASRYWPAGEFEQHAKFQLKPGDVVVAMDRPWVPAGLKWAAIRAGDPNALLVQRCARLRSSTPKLLQDYLRFVIGGPAFAGYIRPITTGVGVPHVSGQQILAFSFSLPSVAEQERIAGILSAYDDLIENCERRIRVLDAMARAIYREWFVEGASEWPPVRATDVLAVNPRVTLPRTGDRPFVPMSSLSNDSMVISDIETRDRTSGAKFQNGDTLLARITPCLENGKTGFVQFLPDRDAAACGSTELIVLRGVTVSPEFVYCLARSDEFRAHAVKSMSGATGRQRVQESCFADYWLPQPPAELLRRFADLASPWFRLIRTLEVRVTNLRQTRDLLLPRLLSGQLSVDDVA